MHGILRERSILFALLSGPVFGIFTCFTASALEPPADKQQVPIKAIIEFKQSEDGPLIYGDLLVGVDFTNNSWKFMDPKGHNIKVGMFAVIETDGTKKNIRYTEKTLCPKKMILTSGKTVYCDNPELRYMRETLRLVKKHIYFKDLQNFYKRKIKACKTEKDKTLKQRMLGRLFNWCHANFLFKEAEKVEKELARYGQSKPKKPEPEPEAKEEDKDTGAGKKRAAEPEDADAREKDIIEAFNALPDIGEVTVLSSRHIVLVSDYLPVKTMNRMLQLGERVIDDFKGFMYDESIPDAPPIPDAEILRIFHINRMTTFDVALRNASTLSNMNDVTKKEDLQHILKLGGDNAMMYMRDRVFRTGMTCHERGDPANPKEGNRDFEDHLVHQLGHTLIANRLRPKSMVKGRNPILPWLGEGMAVYMTIKNLGSKNCACVDFSTDKSKYAQQGKKKEVKFRAWDADIEASVNQTALDDSAEKFDVIIRIPTYTRIGPENLSKSFSMIDFMIENDRVGFLLFLQALQDHYKVLFKENDGAKFLRGLDGIVAKSFTGAAIKKGRKVVPLDSMETLEEAWRDWATNYVLKKTK